MVATPTAFAHFPHESLDPDLEFIGRLIRFAHGDPWRLAQLIAGFTALTLTRIQFENILDRHFTNATGDPP
jgi:hypothetical protein